MAELVCVIDDDESVRDSLPDLLRSFGFETEAFSSAEAFLASDALPRTGCLVLDVAMPGMSGLDLQDELKRRDQGIPIVFISAHFDEKRSTPAANGNVVACLSKPFSETAIVEAVRTAFRRA